MYEVNNNKDYCVNYNIYIDNICKIGIMGKMKNYIIIFINVYKVMIAKL
jgi:hypothetical protein